VPAGYAASSVRPWFPVCVQGVDTPGDVAQSALYGGGPNQCGAMMRGWLLIPPW
jgi:hypothetical protein